MHMAPDACYSGLAQETAGVGQTGRRVKEYAAAAAEIDRQISDVTLTTDTPESMTPAGTCADQVLPLTA